MSPCACPDAWHPPGSASGTAGAFGEPEEECHHGQVTARPGACACGALQDVVRADLIQLIGRQAQFGAQPRHDQNDDKQQQQIEDSCLPAHAGCRREPDQSDHACQQTEDRGAIGHRFVPRIQSGSFRAQRRLPRLGEMPARGVDNDQEKAEDRANPLLLHIGKARGPRIHLGVPHMAATTSSRRLNNMKNQQEKPN